MRPQIVAISVLLVLLIISGGSAETQGSPETAASGGAAPPAAPPPTGRGAGAGRGAGMMRGAGYGPGPGPGAGGAGMMRGTGYGPGPGAGGAGMMRGAGYGPGPGAGAGAGGMMRGMGGGMGMGMGGGGMADEMRVWMALLTNHQKVSRWSRATSYGAEASTTSSDPQIAALIQDHVAQMKALLGRCAAAGAGGAVGACRGPRPWDPLFAAVFANAGDLELKVANKTTPAGAPLGVFVQERGATPFAAKLAAAHAAAVDGFVARGHDAAMEAHAVPSA